ITKYYGC
ncbi:hypothetical protein KM1_332620, partial [Entamoeba histolytica HM-3:IMSS]